VCVARSCQAAPTNNQSTANNLSDAGAGNSGAVDSGSTDSGGETADTGSSDADNGGDDAGGDDMGTSTSECEVDPFDVDPCPDDGNDRFAERFEARTVGCQRDGFVVLDKTETLRFCALEQADRYEVSMVECDERTIRFEAVFKPLVSCDRSLINFELAVQGNRCSEQDQSPDIQCGWNEDGEYVAQALVRDRGSIASAFMTIDTGENSNVDFEYELTARVME
jgi:hypothetical protein